MGDYVEMPRTHLQVFSEAQHWNSSAHHAVIDA